MKTGMGLICLVIFIATVGIARAEPPEGFEDPVLLQKVMAGEVVVQDVLSTKVEFRTFSRSFFDEVSPKEYVDLVTDHPKWPMFVPEIKEGKTTKVNEDRTQFEFWLHVVAQFGLFTYDLYPEISQTIYWANDEVNESRIYSLLLNGQEDVKLGEVTTRLIPYETGILVEDNIHVVLVKESGYSSLIKKEATKKIVAMTKRIREILQGDY